MAPAAFEVRGAAREVGAPAPVSLASRPPPPPRPGPALQRPAAAGTWTPGPRAAGRELPLPRGERICRQVSGEPRAAPTPRASARTRARRAGRCPQRGGRRRVPCPSLGSPPARAPLPGLRGEGRGRVSAAVPAASRGEPRAGPDSHSAALAGAPGRPRAGVLRGARAAGAGCGRGVDGSCEPLSRDAGTRAGLARRRLSRALRGGRASWEKLPRAERAGAAAPSVAGRAAPPRDGAAGVAPRPRPANPRDGLGAPGPARASPAAACGGGSASWRALRPAPRAPRARSTPWAPRPLRGAAVPPRSPSGRCPSPAPGTRRSLKPSA